MPDIVKIKRSFSCDTVRRMLGEAAAPSIEEIEQELFYGVHPLTVRKPVTVWRVTGSRPSNAYYGNAQIHVPTTEEVTLEPGTVIWTANGVTWADRNPDTRKRVKLLWSDPGLKHPFERSYGPGPYFALAQKIRDGILELGERHLPQ